MLVRDYTDGKCGSLRIAGNYLTANYLIPVWAAALKQIHKNMTIKVTTNKTAAAVNELLNYQADAAVLGGGAIIHKNELCIKKIMTDELWFVAAPNHKYANKIISLETIISEPFILRENGSYNHFTLEALCHIHNLKAPKIALEFDGLHESLMAAISGYGIVFCSSLTVHEFITAGKLSRIYVKDIDLINEIVLCTRKNEPYSPLLQNFFAVIPTTQISAS
ncbi:LysR family transcriptional regulator substrate-binding protein [Pectinatus frisingensis]|uniref:LysR family transcriptional regulator substrate-binding protein n=1 Tax=Pectinatus frisingensis TaxID=865 RepID=UPI00227D102E|nr:LysR family transcriptional regulator substrate-binding protein [Pectinatus frisingensis]